MADYEGHEMSDQSWFDDDMEDVEPVVDADSGFLHTIETLNVARIMRCWSESDQTTMLFPGIEPVKGSGAIRKAWETVSEFTRQLRVMMRPITVMRLGDIGWTFLTGDLISTHGDETLTVEVFMTNVYRREEDGWKMIHHHCSPGPHQPSFIEQRLN
jgi:ketosteroid isomerase-like protein